MLAPIPVSRGHSVPACACCRRLWLVLLFLWLLARDSAKRDSRNPVLLKQTPLLQSSGWAWANPQNLSSAPEQGFSLRNWCSNCHLLRLNWPEGDRPKAVHGLHLRTCCAPQLGYHRVHPSKDDCSQMYFVSCLALIWQGDILEIFFQAQPLILCKSTWFSISPKNVRFIILPVNNIWFITTEKWMVFRQRWNRVDL